jgi:hypothetical protein
LLLLIVGLAMLFIDFFVKLAATFEDLCFPTFLQFFHFFDELLLLSFNLDVVFNDFV